MGDFDNTEKDEELVIHYLRGEHDALELLLRRYLGSIYAYAFRLVQDTTHAEDIAQDTFVKVWQKMHTFRPDASFKTWIFTIAHHTALDFFRKKKHIPLSYFENNEGQNVLLETVPDDELLPDALFGKGEDDAMLESLLSTLEPGARAVLTLHYVEGLTFDEIGKVLHKPLNTVKSQHRRALLKLRDLLGRTKPNKGLI